MYVLTLSLLACHAVPAGTTHAFEQGGEAELRANVNKVFTSLDTNRDGCISRPEWEDSVDRLLLTSRRGEFVNRADFRRQALNVFSEFDLNNDGCILTEEYLEASKRSRQRLEKALRPVPDRN
jgi:Ca2+-binding EF-hand superfamily protein